MKRDIHFASKERAFARYIRWSPLALLLLLLVPLFTWLIGWSWNGGQKYERFDHLLYYITETGNAPIYALITSLWFSLLLALFLRRKFHWLFIFGAVFLLQGGTQVIKSSLKLIYQEPRPYMSYLVERSALDIDKFYQLKRSDRAIEVQESMINELNTPQWLREHWQAETGYSFPSGHTIFAACWLFLYLGFLSYRWNFNALLGTLFVGAWAFFMLISRLRLGMHFPIDLFTSILIAYLLNALFFLGLRHNRFNSIPTPFGKLELIKETK